MSRAGKALAAGNAARGTGVAGLDVASLWGEPPAPPAPPVNTSAPTISGSAVEGQTLTAGNGSWTNSPTSYTYQWKAAGASISGATSQTYVLTSAEVGDTIEVTVTATNADGSAAATSSATSAVAAAPMILDGLVAAPTAAFSIVRRMLTSYTGPLLKIRRSNDDALLDIGYQADGTLDVSALLSFVGANDGHITTLYDQSGNSHDFTNTGTITNLPKLVSAGTLIAEINGNPSALFAGDQKLTGTALSTLFTTTAYGHSILFRPTAGDSNGTPVSGDMVIGDSGGYFFVNIHSTSIKVGHYDLGYDHAAISGVSYPNDYYIISSFNGIKIDALTQDGVFSGEAGSIDSVSGNLILGSGYTGSTSVNGFNGYFSELVTFNSELSDEDALELKGASSVALDLPTTPTARVSQVYAEAINTGTPTARVSQVYAEAINTGTPTARVSQVYAEVIVPSA